MENKSFVDDDQVDDKPHPSIQHPEDTILRITSTVKCGSDLHFYHGTAPGIQPGQTLGHEFVGGRCRTGSTRDESRRQSSNPI